MFDCQRLDVKEQVGQEQTQASHILTCTSTSKLLKHKHKLNQVASNLHKHTSNLHKHTRTSMTLAYIHISHTLANIKSHQFTCTLSIAIAHYLKTQHRACMFTCTLTIEHCTLHCTARFFLFAEHDIAYCAVIWRKRAIHPTTRIPNSSVCPPPLSVTFFRVQWISGTESRIIDPLVVR